ncbi:3-hydroxyisobutyrate dehydrogenase [Roseiarcus fermentans]|uniref:3-hydroxyisobutyrate dehydrogenase n=1 Tax=Roseiarcus fermentans TaxID=1473586 RepID=A0A366ERV6_9HYPH|nr:3-hydroxyisobutyrate dehydrogenase [Roseiarcus fermentans]RBP05143.1 3-hydroxyisobutyrate dehydrogenase [Roseiarcus fermentans]
MANIAFLGLGNMGGPMAANLVKAGHWVAGYDLVESQKRAAAETGVSVMGSAREAVSGADIVVTMLPAGRHVLAAWDDFLPAAKKGALIVDSSTIDVDSSKRAHEAGQAAGMLTLDAPVSGGVGGATAGTLTFMCGGSADAFARAKPALEAMGKRIVHCGGAGAGQAAKICNNMILGATMIATCEGFALAEKLGLSAQALFDVASTSSGQSWSLTSYCPVPGPVPTSPANRDWKPGFAASLMLKDLKLAQEAAASAGVAIPLGAQAAQLYALFVSGGHGGDDFSGVINFLRGAQPPA